MKNSHLQTPVLLLVFNRPESTRRVFEIIRSIRPRELYVAADGPRTDRPDEKVICSKVRDIATDVDWPCSVNTLFRDKNLGCKQAVSEGISWFFKHVEEGIILEDDTLPDPSFFRFCEELLERYRYDERVMSIAASNIQPVPKANYSYFFSRYSLMWGWATWRRAWACYDGTLTQWPELRETNWLLSVGDGSVAFKKWWEKAFDDCHAGLIDTWDYPWMYSCWLQNGLTVLPSRNLVRNIGFGVDAAHTDREDDFRVELTAEELSFPLHHPDFLYRIYEADRYLDRHWFGIHWYREVKKSLLKNSWIRFMAGVRRSLRQKIEQLWGS